MRAPAETAGWEGRAWQGARLFYSLPDFSSTMGFSESLDIEMTQIIYKGCLGVLSLLERDLPSTWYRLN